jgi:prepilin-type processing-associated H-X9-DG protein
MKKLSGRDKWMLWATPVVALAPLAVGRVISAWPVGWRWGYKTEIAHRKSCALNLKSLGVALQIYSHDYDEKFPPASIGGVALGDPRLNLPGLIGSVRRTVPTPVGWTGALFLYTRHQEYQFCPAQRPERNQKGLSYEARSPTSRGFVDYWLNARLARRATSTLSTPTATFLLGEGNDGSDFSNATYSRNALPQNWLSDSTSPLFRHLEGANFLFADGHVKWLKPNEAARYEKRRDPFAP